MSAQPIESGPDDVIDLSMMSRADAESIMFEILDSRPNRGVNLDIAQDLAVRGDDAELVAGARDLVIALVDELRGTRIAVQHFADRLEDTLARHHREQIPCDPWCDEICRVADELREL